MSCEPDRFDETCHAEFEHLKRKLDLLDQAIRGNGRVGIITRLDRLEQAAIERTRLKWIVVGALISAVVGAGLQVIQMIGRT